MLELFRHAFGLCSDSSTHPTLLILLGGGFGLGAMWRYIKFTLFGNRYFCKSGAGTFLYAKNTGRGMLLKRSELCHEPNTWGFISGAIDEDEDAETAALREMKEEIKFEYKGNLYLAHQYHDTDFVFYNFIGIVDDEFEPSLNEENLKHKWVYIYDLPYPLHYGVPDFFDNEDMEFEIEEAIKLNQC